MLEIEEDRLGRGALLYQGQPVLHHHLATTCNPLGRSPPETMQEACHCWPISIHLCNLQGVHFITLSSQRCNEVAATQSTPANITDPHCFLLFAGGMQSLGGSQSSRVAPKQQRRPRVQHQQMRLLPM